MFKSQFPIVVRYLPLLHVFSGALHLNPLRDDVMFGKSFTLSWTVGSSDPQQFKIIASHDEETSAILSEMVRTLDKETVITIPRRLALPLGYYTLRAVDLSPNGTTLAESPRFRVYPPGPRRSTKLPSSTISSISATAEPSASIIIKNVVVTPPTAKTGPTPTSHQSNSTDVPLITSISEARARKSRRTGIIFAAVFGSLGTLFSVLAAILLFHRWRKNKRAHQLLKNKKGRIILPPILNWPEQIPHALDNSLHNQMGSPIRMSTGYDSRRGSNVGSTTSESTSVAQERRRRDILSELWTLFQAEPGPRAM